MKLFRLKSGKTIFSIYLNLLHVKFTPLFSDKIFNEHPHKYNLYGLSQMLSGYHIPNAGVQIKNKLELSQLEPPFVAHFKDRFVLVKKITPDAVHFISEEREIVSKPDQFNQLWSGIVLLAEPDEKSIEPEYWKHVFQQFYYTALIVLFVFFVVLLLGLLLYRNYSLLGIGNYILAGVSLIGGYVSYLLVLKQIHIQSSYADKLCSLLKHNDCNNVLESDAAKLWGIISWGEVGLSYFVFNLLIAVFTPSLISYAALFNVCALPYTVWSVWYQKFKAGQWCVLCLIVQTVLWLVFFVNFAFDFIRIPPLISLDTLLAASVFIIPFVVITTFLSYIQKGIRAENTRQELNSIKMKEEVFLTLLKEQGKFQAEGVASRIVFGNPRASFTITILTNPHCNPCSKMHKRVNQIIKKAAGTIRIEYVFSSFGEQFDASGMSLIGLYLDAPNKAEAIYNEWFEFGRNNREHFFEKYRIDFSRHDIIEEYNIHKQWRNKTKLTATPTILINGYKLPPGYTLEDLANFTDIQIQ